VIYSQDGGARPEVIITDTASYTDIVFGLLSLLGFSYRPQLADLPDQKLWRIDAKAIPPRWATRSPLTAGCSSPCTC
jgi:TnpA family transposase